MTPHLQSATPDPVYSLRSSFLCVARQWPGLLLAACCACFALPAGAEVTRFEITERVPFAEGESFGEVGAYERITGRVHYAIAPTARQNQAIVDLDLAPRNEQGQVEFSADLCIIAPVDPAKGNGAILYDVNNRGNKLALRFFNDTPGGNNPQTAGNGYLMRQGFTVVWSGWNAEIQPGNLRQRLTAPVASTSKEPITGLVRYELSPENEVRREPINREGHGAYRPTERGLQSATLTWRLRSADPRVPIPRDQFRLHVSDDKDAAPGQLPNVELEMLSGFRKGYLYELIYEARDPLVHGVCFAAVRDLISALKHGAGEDSPFSSSGASPFRRAHGFGVSQSGRFLREMLYAGFNEDEQGRQVFDGLIPHVAGGGLGSFNHRFAQPTAYNTQRELHDFLSDRFPFAYETQTDPLSGQTDGILKRAVASKVAPKIFHTQTSTEYWSRSGSLVHTDPLGKQDSQLPDNVRVFALGGTQHGPASWPPTTSIGQSPANPGDYRPLLRGLLTALDDWAAGKSKPPESVHPTIAAGTLVDFKQPSTNFPAIPDLRYPDVIQRPSWWDFGSQWPGEGVITRQPPISRGDYVVRVAKCGPDGNELDCLMPPEVAAPIATYTGWGLRSRIAGAENELVGLDGSYIPLPVDEASRAATADPRRSLEDRYGDVEGYRAALVEACGKLVKDRYLLEEDVDAIVKIHTERASPLFDKASGR